MIKNIFKSNKLENWFNVPVIMKSDYGEISGSIKYGVKIPMQSATTPIREIEIDSKEKFDAQKPCYWFVGEANHPKIKLVKYKVCEEEIFGIGLDSKKFKYVIKKNYFR